MENNKGKILIIENDSKEQIKLKNFIHTENFPFDYYLVESIEGAKRVQETEKFDAIYIAHLHSNAYDLLFEEKQTISLVIGIDSTENNIELQNYSNCDYLVKDSEGCYLKLLPHTLENAIRRNQAEKEIRKSIKELERRLIEHTAELETANKELKEFAYVVSHDLKAPLRGVKQLAYWISIDYGDIFDEDGREKMNLLIGRVKRMDNLIDGILQYSRLGRVKGKVKPVNLDNLVNEIQKILVIPRNFKIIIDTELPTISGDETHLEQLFQNLLSNAIKFMDKPKGQVNIGCVDENTHWRFYISDNGPGIDKKYFEKIFQIFQTLSSRDERESTGIGLTLVKKIVELYGGKIWLESRLGEGTTFYFTLLKKGENDEKQ